MAETKGCHVAHITSIQWTLKMGTVLSCGGRDGPHEADYESDLLVSKVIGASVLYHAALDLLYFY